MLRVIGADPNEWMPRTLRTALNKCRRRPRHRPPPRAPAPAKTAGQVTASECIALSQSTALWQDHRHTLIPRLCTQPARAPHAHPSGSEGGVGTTSQPDASPGPRRIGMGLGPPPRKPQPAEGQLVHGTPGSCRCSPPPPAPPTPHARASERAMRPGPGRSVTCPTQRRGTVHPSTEGDCGASPSPFKTHTRAQASDPDMCASRCSPSTPTLPESANQVPQPLAIGRGGLIPPSTQT